MDWSVLSFMDWATVTRVWVPCFLWSVACLDESVSPSHQPCMVAVMELKCTALSVVHLNPVMYVDFAWYNITS